MSHPSRTAYPVNLDLRGKPVLVVGAGSVAVRKVAGLVRAGAMVTVVAPIAAAEIAEDPDIRWHSRPYRRGEVASYWIAVTATDDHGVNAQVAADGRQARVWVNSADDPDNCAFTLPAVARRGSVQVAISTGGRSPAAAAWLRRRIDLQLADGVSSLVDLLAEVRDETKAIHGTTEIDGWAAALDDGLLDLVRAGRVHQARTVLRSHLRLEPSS